MVEMWGAIVSFAIRVEETLCFLELKLVDRVCFIWPGLTVLLLFWKHWPCCSLAMFITGQATHSTELVLSSATSILIFHVTHVVVLSTSGNGQRFDAHPKTDWTLMQLRLTKNQGGRQAKPEGGLTLGQKGSLQQLCTHSPDLSWTHPLWLMDFDPAN